MDPHALQPNSDGLSDLLEVTIAEEGNNAILIFPYTIAQSGIEYLVYTPLGDFTFSVPLTEHHLIRERLGRFAYEQFIAREDIRGRFAYGGHLEPGGPTYRMIFQVHAADWQSLGQFFHRARQFDKAHFCYKESLRLQNETPDSATNWHLSVLYAHMRNFNEAIQYMTRFLAGSVAAERRTDGVPWRFQKAEGRVLQATLILEGYENLFHSLCNDHREFGLAHEVHYLRKKFQDFVSTDELGLDEQQLVLPYCWVSQIGHFPYLQWLIMAQALGLIPKRRRMRVIAPLPRVANRALLEYFRPFFDFIHDEEEIAEIEHLAVLQGFNLNQPMDFRGLGSLPLDLAGGAIYKLWSEHHSNPFLSLSPSHEAIAESSLEALGLPTGSWFVCVHARESGFHGEPDEDVRNYPVEDLTPTIDYINSRGGWVVRMGDASMKPLQSRPGFIDYAHSTHKSDVLDIILMAKCRLYVGGTSGLFYLAHFFGKPFAHINYSGGVPPHFHPQERTIPKLIWLERESRFLSFEEMFSREWRYAVWRDASLLRERGARLQNVTPDEILELVRELLEENETDTHSQRDGDLYARFLLATERSEVPAIGVGRIGRGYLRRHADLLRS